MTLATLSEVLKPALKEGYAIGGLVTLGWEDMTAYTEAAQILGVPVILQAGPSCREHTPIPVLAQMFRNLASNVDVPVVAHLDHGYTQEECQKALDYGFTSLMYDGSRKPLEQNIDETAAVCQLAHSAGISCEGEIGFVGYHKGVKSSGTIPEEAAKFERDSGVDAIAISCGNVHMQQANTGFLDIDQIKRIEAVTKQPLVIHGGSGGPEKQRAYLAKNSRICKFNIGTELRMAFGKALRKVVNSDKHRFDRLEILKETTPIVREAAIKVLKTLKN